MAATLEARRLTEAHRLTQSRLAAQSVGHVVDSFDLLDPERLDATVDRWLRTVTPIVEQQRELSARIAANYLTTYRSLELGISLWAAVAAEALPVEQIVTSLTVTGPVSIKAATGRGVFLDRAVDKATARASNAAVRLVLSGSRDTITSNIAADEKALGYARATSGSPCSFCAMVAGRGFVYKSEDSAGFQPHDGCHCEPEPTYRDDAQLPPGSERFRQMWDESTAGLTGGEARNAFRQALDA